MVAATASLLSVTPVASKPATQRLACRTKVVCAAARPEVCRFIGHISATVRVSSAESLQLRNAGQPAEEQQSGSVRSRRTCSSDADGTVSSFRCRELHQRQAKNLCQQPISKVVQSGVIPAKEVV